jgi:membrane protease YdiL (CAAX protease family)
LLCTLSTLLESDSGISNLSDEGIRVLVGASLVTVGLILVPLLIALSKVWIPERNNFFARWGFTHFVLVVLVWLAGVLVYPPLLSSIYGGELDLLGNLLLMALIFLGPAILIFRLAAKLDPDGIRCLGFRAEGSLRCALFGLSSYILLLPAIFGTTLVWPWVLEVIGYEAEPQSIMQEFLAQGTSGIWLPLLFAVLILPFFEELVFRAFLQPLMVQNFREVGGVVLTSALFALLHGFSLFLPVFALALVMGSIMQRSQRFVACWAIHATHNGLILLLVLYSPGARDLLEANGLISLLWS